MSAVCAHVTAWTSVCDLDDIPRLGARVVPRASGNIAVFRTADDDVFAVRDRCPHRAGPLSQGIVYGRRVACPLHNWQIDLASGQAEAPDHGCTEIFATRVVNGVVEIALDAIA